MRSHRITAIASSICILFCFSAIGREHIPLTFVSPDKSTVVKLTPLGGNKGERTINADDLWDCRLTVLDSHRREIFNYDLTRETRDNDTYDHARLHDAGRGSKLAGTGLRFGKWSPDSDFFAFTIYILEGDHSGDFPVLAYSRRANRVINISSHLGRTLKPNFSFVGTDIISIAVFDPTRLDAQKNYVRFEDFPMKEVHIKLQDYFKEHK